MKNKLIMALRLIFLPLVVTILGIGFVVEFLTKMIYGLIDLLDWALPVPDCECPKCTAAREAEAKSKELN